MSGSEALNMTDIKYTSTDDRSDGQTAIVPGIFFILISISWMIEDNLKKRSTQSNIKPSWVTKVRKYLPVMGVYMVTVSSMSIIMTSVIISSNSEHVSMSYAMITIYAAFSICGLINIVQFYVKTLSAVLPR